MLNKFISNYGQTNLSILEEDDAEGDLGCLYCHEEMRNVPF